MNKYETVYIVNTDVAEEAVGKVHERLTGILDRHGAKEIRFETWGKRKLAYEISKRLKGVYQYSLYLADPPAVAEIQRMLRLNDAVLRYQSVKVDSDIDVASVNFEAEAARQTPLAGKAGELDEEDAYIRSRYERTESDDDDEAAEPGTEVVDEEPGPVAPAAGKPEGGEEG